MCLLDKTECSIGDQLCTYRFYKPGHCIYKQNIGIEESYGLVLAPNMALNILLNLLRESGPSSLPG